MSQLTLAPVVSLEGPGRAAQIVRPSRLRGILSGALFLGARVPFYIGAALLAAVVCVVGVTLYGVHAALGGRHG